MMYHGLKPDQFKVCMRVLPNVSSTNTYKKGEITKEEAVLSHIEYVKNKYGIYKEFRIENIRILDGEDSYLFNVILTDMVRRGEI